MLTSNRGHIDTIEVLQLSISATEQGQNYCKCLFVWHESFFVPLSWTIPAVERKMQ